MSNQRDKDREAYYHFATVSNGGDLPRELGVRVYGYVQATEARIARDKRVSKYTPISDAEQRRYVDATYGGMIPRGVGARQGTYISMGADEADEDTRFLATDFLLDCHALVLVARDGTGKVLHTLLSHVDAMTNIAQEIPKLVSRMPPGTRIEATLLGSPYVTAQFLQSDIMDALMDDKRIARIRYNYDAATTVAVDTTTGRILTATPRETPETSARIERSELPIDVNFGANDNAIGSSYRMLLHHSYQWNSAKTPLELEETYKAGTGFISETSLIRFIRERSHDGLSSYELQEIGDLLSNTLQQPVRVERTSPDEHGRLRFAVKTQRGEDLGDFIAPDSPPQAPATEVKPGTDIGSR